MISLTGNFLLIACILAASGALILKNKAKHICFNLASLLPVICFSLLVLGFINSDFALKNVFLNSSSILPLMYKISASWASHEGSILLWYALLCIMSFAFIRSLKSSQESIDFGITTLAFIQILFCSFILFSSNPFDAFSFIPKEGLGLNPMLQDVGLSIHPPILYLGNVAYAPIFAAGCMVLYKPDESRNILKTTKNFSAFALMTLTTGVGLGSWWAYRELGWGGFWFFDPVENISLLPWLSGIALHHFLMVSSKSDRFLKLSISLSLLTFLMTLYGTFIVRSGIITSVHSFAFSPERGLYIFLICISLTIMCVSWFLMKQKYLPRVNTPMPRKSLAMMIGNITWLISLLSLVVALIYPVYCFLINGIDVAIDPDYFISVFIPIHLPIIVLAAITPYLSRTWGVRQAIPFILSMFITAFIFSKADFSLMPAAFILLSIYLMLQTCDYILITTSNFSKAITTKKFALLLGHFGFGLLALSITMNSVFSQEIEFIGKIGDQVEDKGMLVKLENIKFAEGVNYYRQIAVLDVQDKHNNIVTLKPENRLYKIENTLSQEVDIYSFLFHDLYAVISKVDKERIHAKIYYHPWISIIWLSVLIMASGFLVLLFRRKPYA